MPRMCFPSFGIFPLYYPRNDDEDTSTDYVTCQTVWSGFLGFATIHGVANINTSHSIIKKTVWIMAFLFCIGMFCYQLFLITDSFLSYPVSPVVVRQTARKLDFPAVSVCNTNPIKSSALSLSPRLQSLVDSWKKNKKKKRKRRETLDAGKDFSKLLKIVENEEFQQDRSSRREYGHSHQRVKRQTYSQNCESISGYGDFCLITDTVIAVNAATVCQTLNGYRIAAIQTSNKRRQIARSNMFDQGTTSIYYFIGLSYTNQLEWVTGEALTRFNKDFQTGENPDSSLKYTKADRSFTGGRPDRWRVSSSNDTGMVLCEKDTAYLVTTEAITTTTTTEASTATATTTAGDTTTEASTTTTTAATTLEDIITNSEAVTSSSAVVSTTTEEDTPTTTISTTASTTPYYSAHADRDPPSASFQQENDVLEALAELTEDVKKQIGYKADEFILSCTYDGVACNISEFATFFDAVHGNCYVFNSGWINNEDAVSANLPGRYHGLALTFNLGQHEYVQGISQSAGVVVVVHARNRMPFAEDEGVFASPGSLISIGLNKVTIDRLGDKYSECSYNYSNPYINVYEEYYNVNYSTAGCQKTCYQRYVIERCHCSDPQYISKGKAYGDVQVPICNFRNRTQDDCVYSVLKEYIANTLACSCPNRCSQTTYTYSVSKSTWPSETYFDTFLKDNKHKMQSLLNYSSDTAFVKRNLVKIEVYYREFNFKLVYEIPKYSITMYLADVASILGLWLGMSLFSVAEFLELGADMIVAKCCKITKRYLKKPWIKGQQAGNNFERTSSRVALVKNSAPPISHKNHWTSQERKIFKRIFSNGNNSWFRNVTNRSVNSNDYIGRPSSVISQEQIDVTFKDSGRSSRNSRRFVTSVQPDMTDTPIHDVNMIQWPSPDEESYF